MLGQVLKDITTTKDGNSFDIARVVMTANAVILIPVLILGVSTYIYGYLKIMHCTDQAVCATLKPFDVQTFFDAVITYVGGVGTLLMSGASAIFFKKSTEPNGTMVEETNITKGPQPDSTITENVTNVTKV